MNKRILISLSIIAAVTAITVGGTIAYLNDTETSTNNSFTSGTFNLKVGEDDPITWKFTVNNVQPGDSGSEEVLVQNTGSIDGYLHITFANLVNDDVTCPQPEAIAEGGDCGTDPGAGELAENLDILVYLDENSNNTFDLGTDTLVYQGKARGILQGDIFNYDLDSSDQRDLRVEWSIALSIGNIIQTDKADFDIIAELTQNQKEIVGDWHFDENSGLVAYDSSYEIVNNGTITNAIWTDGKYNPALSLDGTDDYVSVNVNSNLNPLSFTYEFLLYNPGQVCSSWGRLCRVISRGSDTFEVAVSQGIHFPANALSVFTGSLWLNTGYIVPLNEWKHIAITFDSSSHMLRVYVNGTEVYTRSAVTINQTGMLWIGERVNGAAESYRGIIDEVKLYNRVLSSAEVLERYVHME